MPRSRNRSRNNNPTGRNQYSSDFGVTELVRERPMAPAAAAAGAAAAGLFLWSRRERISNQLSNLSHQIGEWTDSLGSGENEDTAGLTATGSSATNRGMSATGGGNASLGRRSGGGGTRSTASGRGRVKAVRISEMS